MGLQLWGAGQVAPVVSGSYTDHTHHHSGAQVKAKEGAALKSGHFNQRYWTEKTAEPKGVLRRLWNWAWGKDAKEPPRRSIRSETNQTSLGLCTNWTTGCTYDVTYDFVVSQPFDGEMKPTNGIIWLLNMLTKDKTAETTKQCMLSKLKHDCHSDPVTCPESMPYYYSEDERSWFREQYIRNRDACSSDNPDFDVLTPIVCDNAYGTKPIPCIAFSPSIVIQSKIAESRLPNQDCATHLSMTTTDCSEQLFADIRDNIWPMVSSCLKDGYDYPQEVSCNIFTPEPPPTPTPTPTPVISFFPPPQKDESFVMRTSLEFVSNTLPRGPYQAAWKIHVWLTGNDTSQEALSAQQRVLSIFKNKIGYLQKGSYRHCHIETEDSPTIDDAKKNCGSTKDDQLEAIVPFSCGDWYRGAGKSALGCFALSEKLYLQSEVVEEALKGTWSSVVHETCQQTVDEATLNVIIPLIQERYNFPDGYPKKIICPTKPHPVEEPEAPWYKTSWIGLPIVVSVGSLMVGLYLAKKCYWDQRKNRENKIVPKPDVPEVGSSGYKPIVEMDEVV